MPVVYVFHIAFWMLFLLRRLGPRGQEAAPVGPAVPEAAATADPHAVRLIVFHVFASFVLYFGLGRAVLGHRGPAPLFAPQPVVGAAVIVAGGVLVAWALMVFRSWRLLARLEAGHQLCTRGPFRIVRHPIYLGMDLLAFGTFVWVPSPIVLAGAILIAISGDRRGRSEERLLGGVFGQQYRDYQARVARAIPGLY